MTGLDGATVKIPGYIVALEESRGSLKAFLLVPYFGACIHKPPPPANPIIHIFATTPVKGFKSMDPVWIRGALTPGQERLVQGRQRLRDPRRRGGSLRSIETVNTNEAR